MSKKIKSTTIFRINHLPGETIDMEYESGNRQSEMHYDEEGNLTLEISYGPDGTPSEKNEYRYDSSGHLAESLIYDENGEVMERKTAFRDASGRLAKEQVHYLDGSVDTYTYSYDDKGHLTGMEVMDDEGSAEYSEKYSYDGDILVRTERYDDNGRVTFQQEDTLKNGVMASRRIWSNEEEEPYTLVHNFNGHGRRQQELRYDSREKLVERNIYEEDDQGRVIRIIEENRQRKNTTDFEYDEGGRLVRQAESDLNGNLNHEVFRTYDEDGGLKTATVEVVSKVSGDRQAYTLLYRHETY